MMTAVTVNGKVIQTWRLVFAEMTPDNMMERPLAKMMQDILFWLPDDGSWVSHKSKVRVLPPTSLRGFDAMQSHSTVALSHGRPPTKMTLLYGSRRRTTRATTMDLSIG